MPGRWPHVLDDVASHLGAKGGNLIAISPGNRRAIASPGVEAITRAFEAAGFQNENSRIDRLVARSPYPGFLTDRDLHSEWEMRTLPLYRDFLMPTGTAFGAATIIQGAGDDGLLISLEAFADADAAWAAVPQLDRLRPHFARAATLSAQLRLQEARSTVAALQAIGAAAALLDHRGRLMAANATFEATLDHGFLDGRNRLHLTSPATDRLLAETIASPDRRGRSIALPDLPSGPCALHVVPIHGDARDLFDGGAFMLLASGAGNRSVPASDLLQALFDLSPAEARVARRMIDGATPAEIASENRLSTATVRTQLASVYRKTGTSRQVELVNLLTRFAGGGDTPYG